MVYSQNIKKISKELIILILVSLVLSMAIAIFIYGFLNSNIINSIIFIVLIVLAFIRVGKYYYISNDLKESFIVFLVYSIVIGCTLWLTNINIESTYLNYVQKMLPGSVLLVISGILINDFNLNELFTDLRNFDTDIKFGS